MRLKKGPSHSFHPPATVHSSRGSHVYTFTNGSSDLDSSSEEELNILELRARGGKLHRQSASREKVGDIVLLEHAITENDNLNKLALQYGCKVADIKRINNFLKEQDMYALKTIKIPVKVHGILTEGHRSADSIDVVIESGDEASVTPTENQDITQYFREIDQNIEAAAQNQELFSDSLDLGKGNHHLSTIMKHKEPNLGADWGIRWWNAVCIMLLIGIVLPVFYIIYYETWKEKSHSANVTINVMSNMSRLLADQMPNPVQYTKRPVDTGG
ncbi:lysM and putative peptidoglycan-binding domain-containing protein 4 [Bufo bufo]|uniref:lysM and putative peptidoglycan-binding domain-containing protein 4 n=1 Tax=Bufo bufo TaxID=8384 RepID=UPI001ABDC733|nr:lysM and putative peptidoglycan-binding domain-containing protein 4 [Bufo bufo]